MQRQQTGVRGWALGLALAALIAGSLGGVRVDAQEEPPADGGFVAEQTMVTEDPGVAEEPVVGDEGEPAPVAPEYFVGASCAYDAVSDQSACTFTATGSTGEVALGVTIPSGALCPPAGDQSLTLADGSASLVFDGVAAVDVDLLIDGYTVETASGVYGPFSGAGLICTASEPVEKPGADGDFDGSGPGAPVEEVPPIDDDAGNDSGSADDVASGGTTNGEDDESGPETGEGDDGDTEESGTPPGDTSGEEPLGRIQIVNGTCPTADDEARTRFTVIDPDAMRIQAAADEGCAGNADRTFTVTGGNLPDDGITLTVDGDGVYRGHLEPGDYTITEDATGEATAVGEVTVREDGIVVVVVINYEPAVTGRLHIVRYVCTDGDVEGTTIYVDQDPTPGRPCAAADGDFQLNDGDLDGGKPIDTEDGEIALNMPIGSHVLTDLASGTLADLSIAEGVTTKVVVVEVVLTGTVQISAKLCADPAAANQDPTSPAYFEANCGGAFAGVAVSLLDAAGGVAASGVTDTAGRLTLDDIDSGTFTLSAGDTMCVIFVDGTSATSGFAVTANATQDVALFGFAPVTGGGSTPDGGTAPDAGPGDGTGVGIPNAEIPVAVVAPVPATSALVTTLPNTGTGLGDAETGFPFPWTFGLALALGAAGSMLLMRRRAA